MDNLQLRVGGFFVPFVFLVVRPSSPRILPVCYAAFCLLLIYVFTYHKKKKRSDVGSELLQCRGSILTCRVL